MKIIKNEKLYERNKKLGLILSLIGMLLLIGATVIAFFYIDLINFSFLALAVGFVLSQIGLYMGNRFGRSPNPGDSLNAALKGMDDRFSLYHYPPGVGANHFLVSPAGLWMLVPKYQKGVISYDEKRKRWKQRGGNLYLKIFGQEGLGRPDIDIEQEIYTMTKFLMQHMEESRIPEINAALVFTHEQAVMNADNSPYPTLHAAKLKEFIRKKSKEKLLGANEIEELNKLLIQE